MAVNIINKKKPKILAKNKVKSKAKAKAKIEDHPIDRLETLVHQMAVCGDKMVPLKAKLDPIIASYEKAKSEVQTIADEMYGASDKGSFQFGHLLCDIGAKANSTKITDKERAIEILQNLGDGIILELVKFGITDLRTYLTPSELEEVVITTRSGKRPIKLTIVEDE